MRFDIDARSCPNYRIGFVELRIMAVENEVAKTPREHFDVDDERPKLKERTLQRSAQYRNFRPAEPGTHLLAPADIWRDMK
jgi:hypothetical protein